MNQTHRLAAPLATPRRVLSSLALLAAAAALAIASGCGGGGGGGGSSQSAAFGRSYAFASAGNVFEMTVDPTGRFTIFAVNPTGAASGVGAQGVMATNGQFTAQTSDGAIQFTGTASSNGATITGSVQSGGSSLFNYSAAAVAGSGASPAGAAGTYSATSTTPAGSALFSADNTGHATLWATSGGVTGGGLLTLDASGNLASADGTTAAHWDVAGGTLTVTKLNGQTVNVVLTLTKVTRAKWTFLVYLDAANNLRDFGPLNFNQMEQVGSTSDVNIVVQWKQAQCSDCGTSSWYGTRRYFVTKNNDITKNGGNGTDVVGSTLVQDLGANVDMGSYTTLHDFITWGQQNYPADHTALVIWDHGSGWYLIPGYRSASRTAKPAARSLAFDDATLDAIDVWQLPQALSVTPKVDMVIMDCSLMQMLEVAYEMRNSTGVVVGSEESPPGFGYPYHLFLGDLVGNPNMTAAQLGADIVNQTLAYYTQNKTLNPDQNNTQSAVDTSKLQALANSMNSFANALMSHATDSAAGLATARTNAESYDPGAGYGDFKDLFDYADQVKANVSASDVQIAANNVQAALNAAIITNGHGPGHPKSHGLSIYVPASSSFDQNYGKLAFANATTWPQWLQRQGR